MRKIVIRTAVYATASVVFPALFVIAAVKHPPFRAGWGKFMGMYSEDLRRFADKCLEISRRLHDTAEL